VSTASRARNSSEVESDVDEEPFSATLPDESNFNLREQVSHYETRHTRDPLIISAVLTNESQTLLRDANRCVLTENPEYTQWMEHLEMLMPG
jgi:hypothetical protein